MSGELSGLNADGGLDLATVDGAILFGRYAFPPQRLGYCGPDDHQAVFDYTVRQRSDSGLVELERRFEGAYPYLRLIALATRIASPFDHRVVEAYWIGNETLERVSESPFYESLRERFQGRMDSRTFGWLASKLEHGARPHHNFHVFDVYTKAGLMRDRAADIRLETMDNCRISWGTVVAVDGAELVVSREPLTLRDGKIALGPARTTRVLRQIEGQGFVEDPRPGDAVSIHWNWACERLSPARLAWLRANTCRALALANQTV
ncbi:MAG TPA: DUF6390 family protein [Ktedonobacterales bacterium]